MPISLLTTKFFFPKVRRDYVSRPHLIELLKVGLRDRLTLICAPAGYGKTTLLSEWHAGTGRDFPTAWLSLDASDSDPYLFLRYLTSAIETLCGDLVGKTASIFGSPQPLPVNTILTSLINEVSGFPDDFALILDDYHTITSLAIHDAVSFLLTHAPPQMHLVLLTREDPPLPLPRLRARGQMVEIREVDLRFSPAEAAAFLAQTMNLNLSEKTVAELVTYTEGWVAGLQMAGLSLQKGSAEQEFIAAFQGQDRYVMDYLMGEVFRQQSDQVQAFLLRTSILERLCASLCDAVLGVGDRESDSTPSELASSQDILEYLDRANLFIIPLDNRREWFRYHHLFADLLRYRLQRESPERLSELHHRACRWYTQVGSPDAAMYHAFVIPDYELVADLLEQFMLQMIGRSRLGTYLSWVKQLPEDLVSKRAYLCVGCGWAYGLTHQHDVTRQYVEAGERALPMYEPVFDFSDKRWISREEVRGHLAALRSDSDRHLGDYDGAIAYSREALDVLPQEALSVRCAVALTLGDLRLDGGEIESASNAFHDVLEMAKKGGENAYSAVKALCSLGSIALIQGKLHKAEEFFEQAVQYGIHDHGVAMPIPGVGLQNGWLVLLHYQRNEIQVAQQHLDIVLQAAEQIGDPQAIVRAVLYQALLDQSLGELNSSGKLLQRAQQIMQTHPVQELIQTEWITFQGQFYLAQGDIAFVLNLLFAEGIIPNNLYTQPVPGSERARWLRPRLGCYLLLARTLVAQDEYDQADDMLERICTIIEVLTDVGVLLEALALRAIIASRHKGNAARALSYIECSLNLAAPEEYVRPFLNVGILLDSLLRQAILKGIHPAFARKLLAALSDQERRQIGKQRSTIRLEDVTPSTLELVDPLTERETQVLRLLAAGLSSTEVAEELVIAVSTSRSYIKSLYSKLGAHSRDEVIAKGQQYGLIY